MTAVAPVKKSAGKLATPLRPGEREYAYTAIDAAGNHRSGRIGSASERDAYRWLTRSGLTPIEIWATSRLASGGSGGRVTRSDVAVLTRELASLVEARVPLAEGLRSLAEQEAKPAVGALVKDIARQLEAGTPLSAAIAAHGVTFGAVYAESLEAAEASGDLPSILCLLADMLEARVASEQKLRQELAYPVLVLGFVGAALLVVMTWVIPRFTSAFEQNGVDLPLLTKAMIAASELMQDWWWAVLGGTAIAFLTLRRALGTAAGKRFIERVLFATPVVGRMLTAVYLSRFARVLGVTLCSGLEVIAAVSASARASGSARLEAEGETLAERMRSGVSFGEAGVESACFPPFARHMLGSGRNAQEISRAAEIVSRHYEREANHLTRSLGRLVEPVLTVLLSIVVLVVALSVFLPMWKMIEVNR